MKRIITLGRACRPAYQARLFSRNNGLETISTPFDWVVTPYISIARILDDDFSPLKVLDPVSLMLRLIRARSHVATRV